MAKDKLDQNRPGEAKNNAAASATAPLQESTHNTDSFSPVTTAPRDSATSSSENVANPDPRQVVSGTSTSSQAPSKISKARAPYTEEQKAFVLHSSRNCKWAEVVSNFHALFPDRPIDEARLQDLQARLLRNKQELRLLNEATTYPWFGLVLPDDHQESEQEIVLGDCSEEEKSFLFYHRSVNNLEPLRVVELFNEHFSKATTLPRLSNLLITLSLEGKNLSQKKEWLKIAKGSEWHEKYLPKPIEQRKKALSLPSISPVRKSRSQGWPLEHQAYLAWLGLRRTSVQDPVTNFQAQFPGENHEDNIKKYLQGLRRNPCRILSLANQATGYSWHERDFLPEEPGYKPQERIRKQVAARQRQIDKIPHPSILTGSLHNPTLPSLASSASQNINNPLPSTAPENVARATEASEASVATKANASPGVENEHATAKRTRYWSTMPASNDDSKRMPPPTSRDRGDKPKKRVHWHSTQTPDTDTSSHQGSHEVPKLTTNDGQVPRATPTPSVGSKPESSREIVDLTGSDEEGMGSPNQRPKKKQRTEKSGPSSMSGVVYHETTIAAHHTGQAQAWQNIADPLLAYLGRFNSNLQPSNQAPNPYSHNDEYHAYLNASANQSSNLRVDPTQQPNPQQQEAPQRQRASEQSRRGTAHRTSSNSHMSVDGSEE